MVANLRNIDLFCLSQISMRFIPELKGLKTLFLIYFSKPKEITGLQEKSDIND